MDGSMTAQMGGTRSEPQSMTFGDLQAQTSFAVTSAYEAFERLQARVNPIVRQDPEVSGLLDTMAKQGIPLSSPAAVAQFEIVQRVNALTGLIDRLTSMIEL